jgi:hypothetical protein
MTRSEIEEIRATLSRSIQVWTKTGNTGPLLDRRARALAEELTERLGNQPVRGPLDLDIRSMELLALFHWARYQVLPADRDQDDFAAMMTFYRFLLPLAPGKVQPEIREVLTAENEAVALASVAVHNGAQLFDEYTRTGDQEFLTRAIDIFAWSAAVPRVSREDRSRNVMLLQGAIQARYDLTHDEGDLDNLVAGYRALAESIRPASARADALEKLSWALNERHRRAGHRADVDEAVRASQEALRLIDE